MRGIFKIVGHIYRQRFVFCNRGNVGTQQSLKLPGSHIGNFARVITRRGFPEIRYRRIGSGGGNLKASAEPYVSRGRTDENIKNTGFNMPVMDSGVIVGKSSFTENNRYFFFLTRFKGYLFKGL